jgi:hypothetical protein
VPPDIDTVNRELTGTLASPESGRHGRRPFPSLRRLLPSSLRRAAAGASPSAQPAAVSGGGIRVGLRAAADRQRMDGGHADPVGVCQLQQPHARLGRPRGELVLRVDGGARRPDPAMVAACARGGGGAGAGGAPGRPGWPR